MKYFVQVNRKFLVSLDAESALRAEHVCLDLDGIWGAHAFDDEGRKTETFRGALLDCETISLTELVKMSNEYKQAWAEVGQSAEAVAAAVEAEELARKKYFEAKEERKQRESEHYKKVALAEAEKSAIGLDLMNN